ncbi:bifunctional ADP-dependent NAD(P)H-hydrate dehydratase/NAD(P)H-hydrate epimerase [Campylobacter sp. MIT 97-5078]|uniref:bifunctional ADP-dependent NAD(P)H-hydrate dehydratase/NAD(P)H-hydrate epimerase n=1 Tax=Campylobacter sp. MIT 97-5078 TaxID=1548153 RepID=UPI00051469E3|nr:bifunctional ADP-dependent NAD(P)H-hydrate dehydratase/NAD(P)H-hydrate epimerase [Campylobacter sp. MIT 97-5078]KGI56603.1 kinase [Campylobacter sp. MIT 97-5078]TQR26793.1 bifunctional ADP-dependent NAD(P)H-hydrate dehydratase/NAD(P)H-hydrate epimerase [Campylobacter sp. MIT 97-5078]
MKTLCFSAKEHDLNAINLGLDELILMENAGKNLALIIKKELRKKYKKKKSPRVLFLLGSGNNAADGLVAARTLKNTFLYVLDKKAKKSALFAKQEQIAFNLGLKFLEKEPVFASFDCIVDCVFGSGFKGVLDTNTKALFEKVNQSRTLKIACDIPSGLASYAQEKISFKADISVSMGCIKELMLEDFAKEVVGKIKTANLGLCKEKYLSFEKADSFLLEKKDLRLIVRAKNTNKGSFGHGFVFGGASAGSLCALAALNFGLGLVSLVGKRAFSPLIMCKERLEESANATAIGMGLDDLSVLDEPHLKNIPLVLDANCFLSEKILPFLEREDVVLTPHPKEFSRLLKMTFNEEVSIEEIQANRFAFARKFALKFNCVLLLKGANPIIAQKEKLCVVNLGTSALAKAGSGDALSGMILALLANDFSAFKAATNASLAHALVAKKYKANANSFDTLKLIKGLSCL